MEINITQMEATTTQDGKARIVFNIDVKDRGQIASLMQKIAQADGVIRVRR